MKKYLYNYIEEINKIIKNKKINKDIISNHLIKINFFQHERIIHLIVTLFFALLFLLFLFLTMVHFIFFIIALIFMVFLIFYIIHYYQLENGVQYLYVQYDLLTKK